MDRLSGPNGSTANVAVPSHCWYAPACPNARPAANSDAATSSRVRATAPLPFGQSYTIRRPESYTLSYQATQCLGREPGGRADAANITRTPNRTPGGEAASGPAAAQQPTAPAPRPGGTLRMGLAAEPATVAGPRERVVGMPIIDADTHVLECDDTFAYLQQSEQQFTPIRGEIPGKNGTSGRGYWLVNGQWLGRAIKAEGDICGPVGLAGHIRFATACYRVPVGIATHDRHLNQAHEPDGSARIQPDHPTCRPGQL
jgi:hypothetical protein